ncbi:hypothetical protein [Flavobacterium sp.]|uniref:hypothetical protein n=1 Tax=Flavobacterium sp. TaxID=239 RepID=UPI0025B8E39E|nr:hypothetical protein [Flavobacterium sp.]
MFKIKALLIGLLMANFSFSQFNVNNLSIEASYGYNGAIQPYDKKFNSNFSAFNHVEFAARYMFTEFVGMKLAYKADKFVNDPKGDIGTQYNSFGLGIIYNAGKKLGLSYWTRDKFGLLVHADAALGFASSISLNGKTEKTPIIGLGITPMYKINNKVALTTDFTYNTNLKQYYGFDGYPLSSQKGTQKGSFYNFSVGLIYYLGENRYHSDWY